MTASQDITELKNDLQELESVLGMVNRSNVRMIIADAISTLRTKVDEVNKKSTNQAAQKEQKQAQPKQTLYTAKISNYGWDESQKFVKVYISLPSIDKLTQEQIVCDFTGQSFKCTVNNHNGKNHVLELPKLAGNIVPATSTCRLKSSNIIVSLKKEKEGTNWGNLTDVMKKEKEKKDMELDSKKDMNTDDPSAGIMNLMKKMYDEGDDEMKRTIKKTWYESQQKQNAGGMPGMPGGMPGGMGGMPGMGGMGGGMPGMPGGMPSF